MYAMRRLGLQCGLQGGHQVGLQGGHQGVPQGVLKFSDGLRKSYYKSGMVKGGFS